MKQPLRTPQPALITPAPLAVFLLSVASGFVSLGYQVMWFRIYADRFGSTNLTFLLVVVCFIGGLGLGSLASQRLSARLSITSRWKDPIAVVALIELAIAATALFTFVIDPSRMGVGGEFPYRLDARGIYEPILSLRIADGLGVLGMMIPTTLMGATFPILCHAFRSRSTFPSELYAWNTLGACLGVLAAEFLLLAHLGHSRSFIVLVAANVAVAGGFFVLSRKQTRGAPNPEAGARDRSATPSRRAKEKKDDAQSVVYQPAVILAIAALAGFSCGALEVDMFRAVRFIGAITDAAMSFTSFWAIVAIFAASVTVRALRRPRPVLIQTAALATLVVYALTWRSLPGIRDWFNAHYMAWAKSQVARAPEIATAVIYPLSASLGLLLAFTGVIVFPAYYFMSLLLPTVCNAVQSRRSHLGRVYGLNTIAFCAGAVLFTWVFPGVNLFYTVKLLFVFMSAGALLALTFRPARPVSRVAAVVAAAIAVAGVILVPRSFDPRFFPRNELPARYPIRAMKSNGAHTTFVVVHPAGNILYFDSHPMSGTSLDAQRYMTLMAHMPLLAHPAPRRALLICFGVGNTARAIASHEEMQSLDIVDLNDKVFETAPEFATTNGKVYQDPRVRMIHDDGRAFLKRTAATYDLVTSEPPPPRSAGVYRLYSVEYYRSVLARLAPDGRMTQWVPVASLSGTAVKRIIASFVSVFPRTMLFVGSDQELILMGGRKPFDAALLERRFNESKGARGDLAAIGIFEPASLLARILYVDDDLRSIVASSSVISDERNDLTMAVTSPLDIPHLVVSGKAVLTALGPARLQCGDELTAALTDRRSLLGVVPDFPMTVVVQ